MFVGDLSNDVSDDVLANAFNKYTSFTKARVIRDRLSQKVLISLFLCALVYTDVLKAKYGFVAFSDPEDFLKAWKEMDGKHIYDATSNYSKILRFIITFFREIRRQ